MKKLLFGLLFSLALLAKGFAYTPPDEGMWLPMFLERLNYVDMQKMGLKLTPEELYSINNSSLKDAIVMFGDFCTAEVISSKGLLLTNHHCGYEAIRTHSSVEHDYLTNGFWAMSHAEELPNEGLSATFLIRMADVTEEVMADLTEESSEADRTAATRKVIKKLKEENSGDGKYKVEVKTFFGGNEYYMFIYEVYEDVRLVGAPPSSIGKYGGDTDNWMWPRHTGDFSMFRIYTAPDGSPAEYSEENVPMKAKKHLPISIKGVKEKDFAMIWGYPGSTERYLTSYGVDFNINHQNPLLISIWDEKLKLMKENMDESDAIRIMYASKYATQANSWKYFIGQTKQLKRLKVGDHKRKLEARFKKWVDQDEGRQKKYGTCLNDIEEGYKIMESVYKSFYYMNVAGLGGTDIMEMALNFFPMNSPYYSKLKENPKSKDPFGAELKKELLETADEFYKNYDMPTDRKIFAAMMRQYYNGVTPEERPGFFKDMVEKKYKGCFQKFADDVYKKSVFASKEKFYAFVEKPSQKVMDKDPAFIIMNSLIETYFQSSGKFNSAQDKIALGDRLFIAGLREMEKDQVFYPDANFTMRMTYGQVLDYEAADAVEFDYYTTLDGVMEKEDPNNDEFVVAPKLKELWQKKDYGRYAAADGTMRVCFITNNDITGGNSGSPVINGEGHLIGCAFDGNWEAMSGDINFETEIQRTICVDSRYILFIVDKMAGAQNLIDEMTIIE